MQPVLPLAADFDPSAPREVGGTPDAKDTPLDLSLLGLELSPHAGYAIFSEQDMYDTYIGMPRSGWKPRWASTPMRGS